MTYIVIDTETTGLPQKDPLTRGFCNPKQIDKYENSRLVQIAWIIPERLQKEYNIRPDGFVIPASSTAIHGVSHETAMETGRPVQKVLEEMFADIKKYKVDKFVAHNCNFDFNIVASELFRAKLRPHVNVLGKMKMECTMMKGTPMCKLPGRYGYKWPSLIELYWHLHGETMEERHNALYDTQLCYKCYKTMTT